MDRLAKAGGISVLEDAFTRAFHSRTGGLDSTNNRSRGVIQRRVKDNRRMIAILFSNWVVTFPGNAAITFAWVACGAESRLLRDQAAEDGNEISVAAPARYATDEITKHCSQPGPLCFLARIETGIPSLVAYREDA